MNLIRYNTIAVLLLLAFGVRAQDSISGIRLPGQLKYLELTQPALFTDNAAALGTAEFPSLGSTYASGSFQGGSFRRPQQPKEESAVSFRSERMMPLGKFRFAGAFTFDQVWSRRVMMSDVLDPYRGNPYILADSVGGNWNKQFYRLDLRAATVPLAGGKINLGAEIHYNASTGARQNDPRPLNYSNQIDASPSLVWHVSPVHALGINGWYRSYKEELNIKLVNTQNSQNLYKLLGLGEYEHGAPDIISTGYNRNYEGSQYGGDLQYFYTTDNLKIVLSGGFRYYSEDVTDGTSKPVNAGMYTYNEYRSSAHLVLPAHRLGHSLSFFFNAQDRKGREYHQVYDAATESFQTIFSSVFYTGTQNTFRAAYELFRNSGDAYSWFAGAEAVFTDLDNRYAYPQNKQAAGRGRYSLYGEKNWQPAKRTSITAGMNAGYVSIFNNELQYIARDYSSGYVAAAVLHPDQAWLTSEAFLAGAHLQYTFPLKESSRNAFFIRGEGSLTKRTGSSTESGSAGSRSSVCFTIGILN